MSDDGLLDGQMSQVVFGGVEDGEDRRSVVADADVSESFVRLVGRVPK